MPRKDAVNLIRDNSIIEGKFIIQFIPDFLDTPEKAKEYYGVEYLSEIEDWSYPRDESDPHNLITTSGTRALSQAWVSSIGVDVSHHEVGTGTTTPTLSDNALERPIAGTKKATFEDVYGDDTGITTAFFGLTDGLDPGGNSATWTEFGAWANVGGSGGNYLVARDLFTGTGFLKQNNYNAITTHRLQIRNT